MRRRSLVRAGALVIVSCGAAAQPSRKVWRIGILGLAKPSDLVGPAQQTPLTHALIEGLRDLGYLPGKHFVITSRNSGGVPERLPGLAAELVREQVDVIVAAGPTLPALKQATSTIPVVMAAAGDPVGSGYVQSLGRPGGNITGMSLQSADLTGKRIEMLKEIVAGLAPVAVLWDRPGIVYWQAAQTAARERGWKLVSLEVQGAQDIEGAFKTAVDSQARTVLVSGAAAIFFPHRQHVAEVAARSRLPVMYELRPFAEAGGLISYGADINDLWRRSAVFVDKILRGAKPADLPVEQPTKFELVINLKTGKALGLAIPQALRLRTDEVIE